MSPTFAALEASVRHLRHLVEGLDRTRFTDQAYPTEWTIADVMSHIGSGAIIMTNGIESASAGTDPAEGFNQSVWDEWNAKSPAAQVDEALIADQSLLDRVGSLNEEERALLRFSFGPMSLDLEQYLGMRLNEHALHAWDIETTIDTNARVRDESVAVMIDNLDLIARYGGKPDGTERSISIRTIEPRRDFRIESDVDSVSMTAATPGGDTDLEIPAEAFIRLLYGRLDAAHTPPGIEHAHLDSLRSVFTGI